MIGMGNTIKETALACYVGIGFVLVFGVGFSLWIWFNG